MYDKLWFMLGMFVLQLGSGTASDTLNNEIIEKGKRLEKSLSEHRRQKIQTEISKLKNVHRFLLAGYMGPLCYLVGNTAGFVVVYELPDI